MTETGAESAHGPDASGRTGPPVGSAGQQAENDAPIPPYDGRTTKGADADDADEPDERKQRFAGVPEGTKGSRTESVSDPDATPGGRTASPADEQPAGEVAETKAPSDPGVGPAHHAGTTRGEDLAAAKGEAGRRDEETTGEAGRPVGTSTGRDSSSVNEQSPDDEDSPTLGTGDQGG